MRRHVAAVYAFARRADDFSDEGNHTSQERLALLDEWSQRLHKAVETREAELSGDSEDLLFVALGDTIRVCDLPVELFENLLSAFRQDVTINRYETWDEVLDYCRRSANPIGRLALKIAGFHNATLDRAADDICTALQLTNFLQDFSRDWECDRLYVPAEIYREFGAKEEDLGKRCLPLSWRQSLAEVSCRTHEMFERGRSVCDAVGGALRIELRLTWLGGQRILDRIAETGYDPCMRRPVLGMSDFVPILWHVLTWKIQRP
jgi:squalene synthase HpnC